MKATQVRSTGYAGRGSTAMVQAAVQGPPEARGHRTKYTRETARRRDTHPKHTSRDTHDVQERGTHARTCATGGRGDGGTRMSAPHVMIMRHPGACLS